MASAISVVSEEQAQLEVERDLEREERGLQLRDTRSRVEKYDRLKKRNKIKVKEVGKGKLSCRVIMFYGWCRTSGIKS